jgi:hypothetical protein
MALSFIYLLPFIGKLLLGRVWRKTLDYWDSCTAQASLNTKHI